MSSLYLLLCFAFLTTTTTTTTITTTTVHLRKSAHFLTPFDRYQDTGGGGGQRVFTWNVTVLLYDEESDDCGSGVGVSGSGVGGGGGGVGHEEDEEDTVSSAAVRRREIYKSATRRAILESVQLSPHKVNVDFVLLDDDCIQTGGLLTLVRVLNNDSVDAVVGAVASPVCRAAVTLAQMKTKLFVSWGCDSLPHFNPSTSWMAFRNFWTNSSKDGEEDQRWSSASTVSPHRYFYRISPSAASSARALVQVIKHFRWKQSAIVTSEDEAWLTLANRVDVALREERFIVRHFIVLHRNADRNQIRDKLATIVSQVKAVILCVPLNSLQMEHVLSAAEELHLGHDKHAFFAVHVRHPLTPPLRGAIVATPLKVGGVDMATLSKIVGAGAVKNTPSRVEVGGGATVATTSGANVARGSSAPAPTRIGGATAITPLIFTYVPLNGTYRDPLQTVIKDANLSKEEDYELFYRVYDCVTLLISVLISRETQQQQQQNSAARNDGIVAARGFFGPILNTPSEGIKVHYTLLYYDATQHRHKALLYVRDGISTTEDDELSTASLVPPPDPSCALDEIEDCFSNVIHDSKSTSLIHLMAILISSAFLCFSLIFIGIVVRRILRRRDLFKGPYGILIYPGDLVLVSPRLQNSNSKHLSDFPGLQEKPDLLKGSHDSLRGFPVSNSPTPTTTTTTTDQCNITRARYNGDLVLVKYFHSRGFELRNKTIKELRMIHDLRHENVNTFLGFFLSPERPALVFEYCTRGSLQDVLSSENIKLDWAFKLSLLTDLVRGVKYLHSSPVRVHGRLTSRNCVIDSRWVLKVTDYGLPNFYAAQGLPFPKLSAPGLLWTAPELLRNEFALRHGTQSGDVYSFSIIMQEVLVRGPPYCMLPLSPDEIIEKVKHPPPMIRPSVSKQAAPPEAINIMRECWAEVPDMRPDFIIIYEQFKRLNHGKKVNIVDTMFQMLEKYSNNLEEIIRERTEQLAEEKKKTDQLLHRMLPSSVAERLKMGLPVEPEAYEEVTIYFSDIVGFTTISAYSTPMEVIDLLNDLYTCFDATINAYNVYKVETIGDAYMVVGGLPVRIEDHACQVATMALELLHQSGKFKIQHLPLTRLKLRIGIHTGPCCAGVVGLTMPRYCLFGDTVNTASRMESTGYAWRIHISQATKDKLDQAGGYRISCRGEIELKGKGKATSYWLLGKDGFDKPLPAPIDTDFDEELLRQCQALPRRSNDDDDDVIPIDSNNGIELIEATDENGIAWCTFQRPSLDSNNGDVQVPVELGRRTLSNASEILAASCPQTASSSDTQSVHSQPHPLAHLNACTKPRKALEYIANANSYILNMSRAHSLDSGEHGATGRTKGNVDVVTAAAAAAVESGSAQSESGSNGPVVSAIRLTPSPLHLMSRMVGGNNLNNQFEYLHHNRRSSEVWESNIYAKDRNQNARRYSNPRFYAVACSDERNGNFLTVASAAAAAAVSTLDHRIVVATSSSNVVDESTAILPAYRDVIADIDNHPMDSSL